MVSPATAQSFRHEALFYTGEDEFLTRSLSFIRSSVVAGEPVLVAVSKTRIEALERGLGGQTQGVHFVDMGLLGRNPARIIPAWREFVGARGASDRPLRGIGEPVWAERSQAELVECHHHESLLNLAFADTSAFWLICPYDTEALSSEVIEEARRTHPFVSDRDGVRRSAAYVEPELTGRPFDGELSSPRQPEQVTFGAEDLRQVRRFVSDQARSAGLGENRTADVVLAVSELATNSVLHAGGRGVLSVWTEDDALLCEVRDGGRFEEALIGRERPTDRRDGGRGLWVVNNLCDLVQMRSSPSGNVVRVHMNIG